MTAMDRSGDRQPEKKQEIDDISGSSSTDTNQPRDDNNDMLKIFIFSVLGGLAILTVCAVLPKDSTNPRRMSAKEWHEENLAMAKEIKQELFDLRTYDFEDAKKINIKMTYHDNIQVDRWTRPYLLTSAYDHWRRQQTRWKQLAESFKEGLDLIKVNGRYENGGITLSDPHDAENFKLYLIVRNDEEPDYLTLKFNVVQNNNVNKSHWYVLSQSFDTIIGQITIQTERDGCGARRLVDGQPISSDSTPTAKDPAAI